MEEYTEEIIARNFGDKQASLSYAIKEVTILGVTYSIEDGVTTSEDLIELIGSDDYPFHMTITMGNLGVIEAGTGVSNIVISLTWPFEQDDDDLDTLWGELAYEYYEEHPDEPSITLKIELRATQTE